ncbi:hypothetical protein SDC9_150219 [bioreactor metagenome]|uniref:DUF3298 domain-containing protein n=1 Tax=bioreactor metagenome TaxID=1076179 RepID=A0A645ENH6_9ZZZZ
MGGAHGTTVRASQTWQVQKCKELPLEQFVHCQSDYKTYVFSEIKTQVQTHQDYYFTKTNTLLVKTFNKNSFYCTPKGIVIYYQQYDIAPYSGGIREFLIPYNQCILSPENLCW